MIYLFVPANDERKARKAIDTPVDAVILDLEASVPDARKQDARDTARACIASFQGRRRPELWVRVNADGDAFQHDLAAIDWSQVDGAVLPHAEDPAALTALSAAGARRLLPMVESGRGFAAIPALAAVRGVERFAIGTWDLLVDFGLLTLTDPDESELIWQLRGLLVLASRQAGVAAPIDGVYAQFDDDAGLEHACLRARQLGFAGKLIVHPRQAVIARRSFRPDPERIRFAREVLAAYAVAEREGSGVLRLRGQMIDRPMVEQARALLAKWGDDDSHIYLDRT